MRARTFWSAANGTGGNLPIGPAGVLPEPAGAQRLSPQPGLVPDTVVGPGYAESVTGVGLTAREPKLDP